MLKALSIKERSEFHINNYCFHKAHDYVATIYVMGNIEEPCSVEINLKDCRLKENQLVQLASVLCRKFDVLQVKKLDLSNNHSVVEFLTTAQKAFSLLQTLMLCNCGTGY